MFLKYITLLFLLNSHQLYVMNYRKLGLDLAQLPRTDEWIQYGQYINIRSQGPYTLTRNKTPHPLLNILYEKNINKLKQLIINGANVNEKDSDQITFLWLLIDLWQYDNNQDNRYTNDDIIDLIHLMMKNGLNVNEPGCLYGSTVLDKAAGKNNITLLELFIHEGTEINKKDTAHNTPLHTAAHNNHKKSVELLLFYDADYKAQNEDGETPYACATKYPEIQKILKNEKSVRKVILEQAQEKVFKGTVPYRAIQNRQYMGSHSRFSAFNRKPRRQEMAMITDK